MPCPTLLAALFLAASTIPGVDVDNAADDRQLFQKLESSTNALAEHGGALKRDVRLEQCRRTRTDAVTLAPTAPLAGPALDGAEIYRRGARAAVLIGSSYKCDKCSKWHNTLASGFAVTSDGVIATSFKANDKVYIGPDKLLPMARFLPPP